MIEGLTGDGPGFCSGDGEGKEVCHNAFAMLNDSRERERF